MLLGLVKLIPVIASLLAAGGVIYIIHREKRRSRYHSQSEYPSERRAFRVCSLCLESLQNLQSEFIMPCHHEFCHECLRALLENTVTLSCPICRKPVDQSFSHALRYRLKESVR